MAGKQVSAADMLNPQRRKTFNQPPAKPLEAVSEVQAQGPETTSALDASKTGSQVVTTPSITYERATVYLRPGQREWLEEVLDKEVRDASGKRIKSISASDIVRLALSRLQDELAGGLPLLDQLIEQAANDAEVFTGRKNRGLPRR